MTRIKHRTSNKPNTSLILSMLRLLSSTAQGCKVCLKIIALFVGIHCIAHAEHSRMSTNVPGFQSLFRLFHHFVLAKLVTISKRINLVSHLRFVGPTLIDEWFEVLPLIAGCLSPLPGGRFRRDT